MQLFYNPDLTESSESFSFDKNESRHIIRVLRKKEGDQLDLTNGQGFYFKGEIINASDKNCLVNIITSEKIQKSWNYNLHIAIAPTKMNNRLEWFIEKATEIGIDEITPIICDHSERKAIKHDRIEKVMIAAAKQSLKFQFPKLNPAMRFNDFIEQKNDDIKLIAHCEDSEKNGLKDLVEPNKNITVLIGPEGDFSPKEIGFALHHKYIPLSLGESRLRTETAGVVACSSIAIINE